MKLQFSLATLLVCMTVLAVVCAASIALPVSEWQPSPASVRGRAAMMPDGATLTVFYRLTRPPNGADVAWRMALWGIPAVAATLGVPWTIRRLKSRRHTEPPVG
jgi:hypothetical protein